jgi:4-hydroxythreonine-4-phosphate dehydrogenase
LLLRTSHSEKAMSAPNFVFMLTRNDRTIAEARARLDEVIEAGVRHIGFKDIGLNAAALRELSAAIRASGARIYLEVVSLDEASEIASARTAVTLQVDFLLGGTRPGAVLPVIRDTGIGYFPFPGRVIGHPSRLVGSVGEISASAKALADLEGVDGLDLLAYRFTGDVPELIATVCKVIAPKPVIVAGSIDRQERIAAVVHSGAAGFTVGTAALDGVFPARSDTLSGQLEFIQAVLLELAAR